MDPKRDRGRADGDGRSAAQSTTARQTERRMCWKLVRTSSQSRSSPSSPRQRSPARKSEPSSHESEVCQMRSTPVTDSLYDDRTSWLGSSGYEYWSKEAKLKACYKELDEAKRELAEVEPIEKARRRNPMWIAKYCLCFIGLGVLGLLILAGIGTFVGPVFFGLLAEMPQVTSLAFEQPFWPWSLALGVLAIPIGIHLGNAMEKMDTPSASQCRGKVHFIEKEIAYFVSANPSLEPLNEKMKAGLK